MCLIQPLRLKRLAITVNCIVFFIVGDKSDKSLVWYDVPFKGSDCKLHPEKLL